MSRIFKKLHLHGIIERVQGSYRYFPTVYVKDVIKGAFSLSTPLLMLHAIISVLGVFATCVIIDQIRIKTVERYILDKVEKGVNKLLLK